MEPDKGSKGQQDNLCRLFPMAAGIWTSFPRSYYKSAEVWMVLNSVF